jgi:hypothetical protein
MIAAPDIVNDAAFLSAAEAGFITANDLSIDGR